MVWVRVIKNALLTCYEHFASKWGEKTEVKTVSSLIFDRYSCFQTSIASKPLEQQTPNKCQDVGNIAHNIAQVLFSRFIHSFAFQS
jgi:hypothetical protein